MEPESVAVLLDLQCGVISRCQVLEAGGADKDVARCLRRRLWARVHDGVYVNHTGQLTDEQRAWAAVLFYWPAALAGDSALLAHGARTTGRRHHEQDRVEVAIAYPECGCVSRNPCDEGRGLRSSGADEPVATPTPRGARPPHSRLPSPRGECRSRHPRRRVSAADLDGLPTGDGAGSPSATATETPTPHHPRGRGRRCLLRARTALPRSCGATPQAAHRSSSATSHDGARGLLSGRGVSRPRCRRRAGRPAGT